MHLADSGRAADRLAAVLALALRLAIDLDGLHAEAEHDAYDNEDDAPDHADNDAGYRSSRALPVGGARVVAVVAVGVVGVVARR